MDRKDVLYPKLHKRLERIKENLKASKEVSKANKELILGFLVSREASGTGTSQQISYMDRLIPMAKIIGKRNFRSLGRQDMEGIFADYKKSPKKTNKYSQASLNKIMQTTKCFFRWLYGLSSVDPAPEPVRWMERKNCPNKLRAEDLWTEEDMEKIIKVARSLRDKCILSVFYEAGLRPGELRGLKIKDVVINGDMIRLYVAGKTEKKMGERVVPILRSYQLLRMWLSQHPKSNDTDAWLWSFGKDPMKEVTLRFMVGKLAEKAGIKKPTNPYILRHTALTRFYKKLPGTVASKLAGHVPGSKESQTYCHLAESDLDNAVRELNGSPRKETEEKIKCLKCGQSLGIGDRICPMCGLVQDDGTALKRMNDVEEALNVNAALKVLGRKYPELGELINTLLKREDVGL